MITKPAPPATGSSLVWVASARVDDDTVRTVDDRSDRAGAGLSWVLRSAQRSLCGRRLECQTALQRPRALVDLHGQSWTVLAGPPGRIPGQDTAWTASGRRGHSVKVRDVTEEAPACPECGHPMKSGGLVLSRREDDRRRVCRALWRCRNRHLWWGWADRPDEPLETCPAPELFR